eukprot:4437745-Amphidinium_carterae.2
MQIKEYLDISTSFTYHSDAADDVELIYVHGTASSLANLLQSGNLKTRYAFGSAFQAAMHRISHHHFGLSCEDLSAGDEVILGITFPQEEYTELGRSNQNGYCSSLTIPSLVLKEGVNHIVSLWKFQPGLQEFLGSEAILNLTRQTISSFESFQTSSSMSDSRLLSLESLRCLMIDTTPGAGKIQATLKTQAPEFV